ncbi:MAG: multidrug efflux SMR transporter [Helicobacter sp.]|uniref:DMT family transporter n=1 Tax=Helicobacter sp. TaxID=218 RepID=UPI0023C72D47|nr:multidrug efflux SMR transporter [Helicobacter sp.]MDE5926489.1 multidrug efflux SMR transporter [Helicobacter sp.]MDE7175207.1 multidrug efflux SMR transporter [Helicobacter sp.]
MYWIILILAGCMEIGGIAMMKSFTTTNKKIFLLGLLFFMTISFGLLSLAMQEISMGTAYAIWTGIGAGGGVLIGILFLGESKSIIKLTCVSMIILCSIGLKLVSY